ncbi:MAG: MarR family transcriptional regulator [Bacteroidales bacterium]|nr:MarR family transcriptional regulator [Bacteroidales bacterium]
MSSAEKIFELMKSENKPLKGAEIAELSGLDRKEVDKAMKELKNRELIFSPKNCFWQVK